MGARTLAGEHDFCLGFSFEEEDKWELSLPLDAEAGLLGIDDTFFGLWSASWDKQSRSEGFDDLDFTVGEAPREGTELFKTVALIFFPDEDLSKADRVGEEASLRVGVADLVPDFETTGIEGLEADVDEHEVGLTGVKDLAWAAAGFEEGSSAALGVGMEGEGLDFAEGRPVGVAALRADVDEGLLLTVLQHSTLASADELSLTEVVVITSCGRKHIIIWNFEPKNEQIS